MLHPRSIPAIDCLCSQDGADEIYRALHRGVEYAIGAAVDGHIAEFGTSSGRTALTLAKGMADFGTLWAHDERKHGLILRKLLLFDGFEGFPRATHPIDQAAPHIKAGVWGVGATKDASPETLMEMCGSVLDKNRIEILAGWYSETMPKLAPGLKLAMVHIDCDFYESTITVLDRLFTLDALADGCAIFFDDWYCNRGSPEFGEQRAWAECVRKHQPRFTDWGPYATFGRKFLVHH
jgi:Macrocin-O-methyltransferase (TylF)